MGEPTRFFFVHVMKTGGTSFIFQQMKPEFAADEFFPTNEDGPSDGFDAPYFRIDALDEIDAERHRRIRAYTGHWPLFARDRVPGPVTTLTMLRDPVERTISYLKHCQRYHPNHRDLTPEEIYEDEPWFVRFILDHQTKVFSLREDDGVDRVWAPVPMDRDRLTAAKAALETVDLVGVQHRYDDFVGEAHRRFGWPLDTGARIRAGQELAIPDSFRARIASDLELDMELFAFADELVAARR